MLTTDSATNPLILLSYYQHISQKTLSRLTSVEEGSAESRHVQNEQEMAACIFDNINRNSVFDSPNIATYFSPQSLFNGDLILSERLPNGNIMLLIGDFTSKGLPAAIGTIPTSEIFHQMCAKGFSFESIIREINRKLKQILPPEIYCAACIIEFHVNQGQCKVFNGGLPDIILLDKEGQIKQKIAANQIPLGVVEDSRLQVSPELFRVESTDCLIASTYGIVKVRNQNHEIFGIDNYLNIFNEKLPPKYLIAKILEHIKNFASCNSSVFEATTLLALSFKPEEIKNLDPVTSNQTHTRPLDWCVDLCLPTYSLKNFDPLPVILNILMEERTLEAHRSRLYAILAEIYSNALDHGVLGLDSKDKHDAKGFTNYYTQRQQRLDNLCNAKININIAMQPDEFGGRIIIRVEDSGAGFDYAKSQLNFSENKTYSGRGMSMLYDMCEKVAYQGKGNIIEVTYRWT